MAPPLSAAAVSRPCGYRHKPKISMSWGSISKALSRRLRETDPAFREISDRMSDRARRKYED